MFRAGEPTTIKPDSDRFSIYCLMVYVIWRRYTGSTPTLFEEKQLVLSKSNWFHVSLEMFYESAIAFKSPILVLRYWNMIGWPEQGDLVIVTQFSFSRKDRVYFEIIADCILKSNCRNISRLLYLYTYFLKSNYTHKKLHSRNHSLS